MIYPLAPLRPAGDKKKNGDNALLSIGNPGEEIWEAQSMTLGYGTMGKTRRRHSELSQT